MSNSNYQKNIKFSGHLRYTRSSTFNYGPYHHSSIYPHHSFAAMGSPYYHRDMEDPISPALPGHHRSRSASRPPVSHTMDYPSKNLNFQFSHSLQDNSRYNKSNDLLNKLNFLTNNRTCFPVISPYPLLSSFQLPLLSPFFIKKLINSTKPGAYKGKTS